MILRLLLASLGFWPALTSALACEVTANVLPQVTWENFKVSVGRDKEIFVVHEKLLADALRKQVTADLADETLDIHAILQNAETVLKANRELLSNHAALLMIMDKAIKDRMFKTVYLDYPSKNIPELIAFSKQMYLRTFALQMHGSPSDILLDRLLILTIGVPLYLHAIDGPTFSYMTLEGLPAGGVNEVATVTPPLSEPEADANDHFQILEEKLRHNHDSLATARAMRRRLRDGEFRRLSNDEIRHHILSRFWRPARPAVREWLNAELAEAKTKAKRPPSRHTDLDNSGVARGLLTQTGRSILFLHDEHFARFKKDFRQLCD